MRSSNVRRRRSSRSNSAASSWLFAERSVRSMGYVDCPPTGVPEQCLFARRQAPESLGPGPSSRNARKSSTVTGAALLPVKAADQTGSDHAPHQRHRQAEEREVPLETRIPARWVARHFVGEGEGAQHRNRPTCSRTQGHAADATCDLEGCAAGLRSGEGASGELEHLEPTLRGKWGSGTHRHQTMFNRAARCRAPPRWLPKPVATATERQLAESTAVLAIGAQKSC